VGGATIFDAQRPFGSLEVCMGMMAHRCKRNGELGGTAPPLRSALTSGFEGESPQILLS